MPKRQETGRVRETERERIEIDRRLRKTDGARWKGERKERQRN